MLNVKLHQDARLRIQWNQKNSFLVKIDNRLYIYVYELRVMHCYNLFQHLDFGKEIKGLLSN